MASKDDLETQVGKIFRSTWVERDGTVVPDSDDVGLGNDAVNLKATVLYADMADSTNLVNKKVKTFAAEVYKTILHCAAKIIADFGGEITAYDGDRVMAVFIGERKNTRAARSALTINYAVNEIIRPACKAQYQNTDYVLKHVVGIDTSDLFVARTGVRGANDLVWVGNAANVAAKLSSLSSDYPTYITERVYKALAEDAKTSAGQSMWERAIWSGFDQSIIYRSTWQWPLA